MKRKEKKKIIGLNLFLCIFDIVRGEIDSDEVSKIIADTRAKTPNDWEKIIASFISCFRCKCFKCCRFPWCLKEAEAIFRKFIEENRIEQPRLNNDKVPIITDKIWVSDEKEIIWS